MSQGQQSSPPRRAATGLITIDTPPVYGTTRVLMGSGPSGFVCAEGQALDYQSVNPQSVRGKVIALGTDPGEAPPMDATAGVVNGNYWCIKRGVGSDIPGAVAGQNTIAIWVCYGGSPVHWEVQSRNFQGVADTDTECGAETVCPSEQAAHPQAAGASVIDTAPAQWLALVTGLLGGASAALNGSWLLTLRPQAELRCVWDNGGDGETVPHVELGHDGLKPREWILTLRHGPQQLRYVREAREWNWLGANLLYGQPDDAAAASPLAVEVVPV